MAMRARARIVGAAREASPGRTTASLAGAATRRKQNDSGPHGSGRTAEKPSPVSAAELNDVLAAAHARVDKLEPRLAAVIEPILKKYGDTAARKFSEHATQHLVAAGPDWTAPFPDQLIDVDALVAEILAKTQPVRDALIEQTMSPALAAAGIRFDVANPLIAGQIANTGAQVTNIAETTRANIMRIIGQATQNGLTVPQTSSLIREGMASASKSRSVMIARTEMGRAVSGGSLTATQMVAKVTGASYDKTWHTASGAVYPRHENYEGLDGQTVGLDAAFDVGGEELQYPGDPSGDPGETVNCRCSISYLTPSGEQEADAEDPPELDTIDTAGDGGGGGLMAGPDALTQPLQPLTSSNSPAALARSLSGRARAIEPAVSKAVSASADAHGAQLAGYEFRLKKEASAARKIAEDALERGKTARETAYEVSDMVRYTATFSPEEYVARSDAMLRDLQGRGIKVVRFRNTWEPDAPYAGLNVQMAAPNGYRFELQFHTADSFYLKEAVNHPLYEEWRLSSTSQTRKTELLAEMRANVAGLTVPDGVRGYEFADTPAATDIAVTPFRPHDDPIGFYDSRKYQAFVDRAHTTANDYGVVIDKIEHTTGVWQGETEPSASISAHDGDVGLKAFSASLGGDYGQDAVLVFNDVPGEAMMATFSEVQAQSVYFDALREAGIEGARITVDGRLQVIGGGVEFAKQLARLGELLDSEYEVAQGTSTLLERDAYESALDLFRNGPAAAPVR